MVISVQRKLRVGVLGLGMAGGMMVPYLVRHPRATLVAAADRDSELRSRFMQDHHVEAHAHAEALICRTDVDAIYIATPHQFHKEHALLAAKNGKHIVVEKPMALSLPDCDAMIEAAERHRVALIVGHTHSFDPAIREIGRLVENGALGPLSMLAMWNYTDFLYRPRRPEELDTTKGGGILFNQIPHQVDIARLLAGSAVRSVRATTGILDPRRPTEGCCTAFIDFESGAVATAVYSGYDHFDSDEMHSWVSSTGRKKTPRHGQTRKALAALKNELEEAHLRGARYGYGGEARFLQGEPEHQAHFGSLIATYEHADLRTTPDGISIYSDEGMREITLPPACNGRSNVIDELCDVAIDGRPTVHDGRFARGTVEVCLAIHESARQRREVFLRPPGNETPS
jgi:phthalate 4,5-cis-dihydrodiol dehydrogenase